MRGLSGLYRKAGRHVSGKGWCQAMRDRLHRPATEAFEQRQAEMNRPLAHVGFAAVHSRAHRATGSVRLSGALGKSAALWLLI